MFHSHDKELHKVYIFQKKCKVQISNMNGCNLFILVSARQISLKYVLLPDFEWSKRYCQHPCEFVTSNRHPVLHMQIAVKFFVWAFLWRPDDWFNVGKRWRSLHLNHQPWVSKTTLSLRSGQRKSDAAGAVTVVKRTLPPSLKLVEGRGASSFFFVGPVFSMVSPSKPQSKTTLAKRVLFYLTGTLYNQSAKLFFFNVKLLDFLCCHLDWDSFEDIVSQPDLPG